MDNYKGRKSIRLQQYDYSTPGYYFITICVQNRACLFGKILNGKMLRNELGDILDHEWCQTLSSYPNIKTDKWIVMPNHFHGLVQILDFPLRNKGHINASKLQEYERRKMLIPKVVGKFKMQTAKLINQARNKIGRPLWMRGYWDRVVRNEAELSRIREYIVNNPLKWELDKLNPTHNP